MGTTFNRTGMVEIARLRAVQASGRQGHAAAMVVLRSVSGGDITPWNAEASAWEARRNRVIGSCVFPEDAQFIASAAEEAYLNAFDSMISPDPDANKQTQS